MKGKPETQWPVSAHANELFPVVNLHTKTSNLMTTVKILQEIRKLLSYSLCNHIEYFNI